MFGGGLLPIHSGLEGSSVHRFAVDAHGGGDGVCHPVDHDVIQQLRQIELGSFSEQTAVVPIHFRLVRPSGELFQDVSRQADGRIAQCRSLIRKIH